MKQVNLFTSNLQGKARISEISAVKKATAESLKDYEKALDGAFNAIKKSSDKRSRDLYNAVRGRYANHMEIVANCYPWQTADGKIAYKKKDAETGIRMWAEKNLTWGAAKSIAKASLDNFTNHVGDPVITIVNIGEVVE